VSELIDAGAERAVLSGLFAYGLDVYVEISDIITYETFGNISNQTIYKCAQKSLESNPKLDIPSLLSAAEQIGLSSAINSSSELEYISLLTKYPVAKENVLNFAIQIKKFEFARNIKQIANSIAKNVESVKGDESIDDIISILEKPVVEFIKDDTLSRKPEKIWENVDEYVEYLINNKCDQIGIETGFKRYDKAIGGGLRRKCVDIIAARPKALRHGSRVYTDAGYKKIEDIKVGDIVKHPFKGNTKVTNIWPHKNIDIYRIYFKDGDYVDCCEDHLWHVEKSYCPNKSFIKTTKELLNDIIIGNNSGYKWNIPLPSPVEFEEKPVPIDPYALGILLGDGSVANNTCVYHTADEETHNYMKSYAESIGLEVKLDRTGNKCNSYRINGMQDKLRESKIWGHNCYSKFIPEKYIYNSTEVRMAVLAGLLDTDGDCTIDSRSKQSRTRFGSVSFELCKGIKEIVQSLGGLCSINKTKTSCNGKNFTSYRCEIRLPQGINPFRLTRKKEKFTERIIGKLKRTIIKIQKIGQDNARCLTLENNDGLFMTDNYVVTHNTGKSALADNVAINIGLSGIPVLMLDTEMSKEDHLNRIIASLTGIEINKISTGKFSEDKENIEKVQVAVEKLKGAKYTYASVAGAPFENIINTIKRWILHEVGHDENGRTNDCVVIYDYLKLMSSSSISNNLQEYQVLGFQITSLHNLAVKYDFPCLAFTQLNRDGITRETTDVVSGSDRIIWLCTSFSIFKDKSPEELAEDGPNAGNRKLIPIVSRHGPGMTDGNYINIKLEGDKCIVKELHTRDEFYASSRSSDCGIEGSDTPFDPDDDIYA
jgi:replicative DNA helicase